MKVYKQIMNGVAWAEKLVICITLVLVSVITFANVLSRFVFHASFSWSEELVVNVFVLLTMLGCALCARDGSLVSLSLFFDLLKVRGKKVFIAIITLANIAFYAVLLQSGVMKVLSQIASGKKTFSLRVPEWMFTVFLPIGAFFLILHTVEFFIDVMRGDADCVKQVKDKEGEKN